jgi:CRP-like cAMP-binding protein
MTRPSIVLPEALRNLLPAGLQPLCTASPCTQGGRLFRQGRKTTHMLFVAEGEVVLQRLGIQGEILVHQRTRHGFIGEASLQSMRYHCDAVVLQSGVVIAIPVEPFKKALDSDSAFASRWIAMLNAEIRRLRAQSERLSMKGVKKRLLHLIETEGQQGRLPMGAGLKSLASELAVTHEALYRAVADLENRGVLQRQDNFLIVPRIS